MPPVEPEADAAGAARAELVGVLLSSLAALGEAGHGEQASRLAGTAYANLRRRDPVQAQRINVLMHRLLARG